MNWHQPDINRIFEITESSNRGLTTQIASARLQSEGYNELRVKKKQPVWKLFFLQFRDLMILILLGAALLAGITGETADMLVILAIVILNAIIGFIQEYKAGKAMEAMKKLDLLTATVLRNGTAQTISSKELVRGDIVFLEAGCRVPADLRLIETFSLQLDESSLTGESVPVYKHTGDCDNGTVALGDRFNMVYKSTMVTSGRGIGVVIATGMNTEFGHITTLLEPGDPATPLQRKMADFSRRLSGIILIICAIVFATGIFRGQPILDMLLVSVSLAVAAIPEALPALITISLALAAKKMVTKNILIRKLTAVETLGAVSIICTDKTGTITQNKMKVVELVTAGQPAPSNQGAPDICLLMALNHDVIKTGNTWKGEPTEMALLEYAQQNIGPCKVEDILQNFPKLAELPFNADTRSMITVHRYANQFLLIVKGATETIVGLLQSSTANDHILSEHNRLAANGARVIAYGYRLTENLPGRIAHEDGRNLIFAGLAAMIDPAREEVSAAIKECKSAGIIPVMITGDHPQTAAAIAKQTGILLPGDLLLSGPELEKLPAAELDKNIERIRVYARVSPQQKLAIIESMQRSDHFTAMTGDGVNDAPSLKTANIGIAMGISGTDVSKEAAHMILLDDNFASIIGGIREGRRIYDNIRKFVKYILTCNSAEIYIIALAPVFGLPIPLLPIQILWINLATDGLPGLALSAEKGDWNIMKRPPRKAGESLFAGGTGFHILWAGILLAALLLSMQGWYYHNGNEHWNTIVFTALGLSQLAHVMAVRSEVDFIYRKGLFSNKPLGAVLGITALLQIAVIYLPAGNRIFKTKPLSAAELIACFAIAAIFFHAVETEKWIKKFRTRKSRLFTNL